MTNEQIVVQGVGAGVGVGVGVGMGMSGYRQQNFGNQSQFATQTVGFKKQTESQFQTQAQPQPRPQPQPQPQFQFKPIQTQPTQPTQPKLETKLHMQLQPENSMTKDLTKQPQLSGFQFGKAPLKSTIEANAKVQKSIESVNPIGLSQKINENIGKLTGMENQQTSSTARDDFGGFKFGAPQKFEATAQPSVQIGNVAKPQISPEPSEIQGEVRVNWEYNRRESITTMELARFLYTDIIGELVDQVVFKEYRKRQKAEKMASELVQPIVEQLISEIVYQETYTNVFAELCNTKQQQFRKQSLRRLGLAKFKEMAKQYKAAKKQKEYINSVIYGDQTIKLVTPRSYRHIEKALRQSRGKSNKRLKISHDLWDSAGLGKTVSQTLGWSGNPGFYGQIRANIQLVTVGHKTQLFERWVWWHIDDKISAEDPSVSPEYITSNQSNIQLRFFRSKTIESADAYILLVDPGLTSKDTKANGQAAAASHPPHVVDQLCHLLLELAQQPNQPMVALLALSDCTEQSLVVADAVESSVRLLFSRDEVQAEQNRRVKLFGLDISEHSVVDDLTNPFMWLVAGLSQKMLGSDTYLLPNQFFFRQAYDLYDHLFVPLFSSSINISHIPLSSGVLALIVGFINHIISQICSLVDVSAPELSTSYPACKSGSAFQSTAFVRRLLAQYSSALSLALNVDVDLQSIQGLVSFDSGTFLHGDIFGKDQRSCNEVYVSPTFVYEFYHLVYLNILETLNLHVLKRYNYVAKPTMDLLLYSTCEHTKWCISQYLHWYNSNHTALTAHIESLVLQRNKLHSKANVDNRNVVTNGVGASIKNKSVCGGIISSSTRKSITSLYSSINDALNLL
ncbi:hypothetical protein AX774_g5748 [Zancudomyces culisetae]|uniref:Uncharacterized protein n=1 Tax=Zancudomyces culisetae TaxID=1213189 RepID=A0A1R1PIQ9_ZANCU|nr:hypothetical protein AX774_g5748 [Zancudomyces culisetae]|eukprot:OMH80809.1 hypothetical protein AX774_g5748 [Zancudomyces culisetae]